MASVHDLLVNGLAARNEAALFGVVLKTGSVF